MRDTASILVGSTRSPQKLHDWHIAEAVSKLLGAKVLPRFGGNGQCFQRPRVIHSSFVLPVSCGVVGFFFRANNQQLTYLMFPDKFGTVQVRVGLEYSLSCLPMLIGHTIDTALASFMESGKQADQYQLSNETKFGNFFSKVLHNNSSEATVTGRACSFHLYKVIGLAYFIERQDYARKHLTGHGLPNLFRYSCASFPR